MKADRFGYRPLAGPRTVAVLFDKPSLRTRVSFAVGIAELGGLPLVIDAQATQLVPGRDRRGHGPGAGPAGGRDRVAHVRPGPARAELAAASPVPVINALTDRFHPCQILADLQTVREAHGRLAGLTLAFLGDGSSNMAHSYLLGGATAGLHVRIAAPERLPPGPGRCWRPRPPRSRPAPAARSPPPRDPKAACADADVLATDVWTSMGQEGQEAGRTSAMAPYQLNEDKLALAAPGCRGAALPARAPRRGDHRRGHRRPRQRGLGPGREPAARAEGAAGLAAGTAPVTAVSPVTKAARHAQIAGILEQNPVRSQEELAELLARRGVRVTQTTLSRDLDELGAVRLRRAGRRAGLRPARPARRPRLAARAAARDRAPDAPASAEPARAELRRLARAAAELLVSAEASANLVVLRTPAGAAQYFASVLDHARWSSILGTVAGDDTVLVIASDPAGGADLAAALLRLAERRA